MNHSARLLIKVEYVVELQHIESLNISDVIGYNSVVKVLDFHVRTPRGKKKQLVVDIGLTFEPSDIDSENLDEILTTLRMYGFAEVVDIRRYEIEDKKR